MFFYVIAQGLWKSPEFGAFLCMAEQLRFFSQPEFQAGDQA
jgi:hypothetical protein